MFGNWRLSSFNGVLLAAYFIPTWSIVAYRIMMAPVHGLFERPNISVALFLSDQLHFSGIEIVRAAWLLALARLTVVAFFAIFLILASLQRVRREGGSNEPLAIALLLGSVISFASMVMASGAGETGALRLHATELLLLLGTSIVMLVEPTQRVVVPSQREAARMLRARQPAPSTGTW
jgi:hypothetical protein